MKTGIQAPSSDFRWKCQPGQIARIQKIKHLGF